MALGQTYHKPYNTVFLLDLRFPVGAVVGTFSITFWRSVSHVLGLFPSPLRSNEEDHIILYIRSDLNIPVILMISVDLQLLDLRSTPCASCIAENPKGYLKERIYSVWICHRSDRKSVV